MVGDQYIYVGPAGEDDNGLERFPGATYEVQRVRSNHVWLIQLPYLPENIDWHGALDDLADTALWQPTI